mgnify:CR=1 FL=1
MPYTVNNVISLCRGAIITVPLPFGSAIPVCLTMNTHEMVKRLRRNILIRFYGHADTYRITTAARCVGDVVRIEPLVATQQP